jgi:hypothetical protein
MPWVKFLKKDNKYLEDFAIIIIHILVNSNILKKKIITVYGKNIKKKFKSENFLSVSPNF